MNIHEYQAKKLLLNFSLPIPKGFVAQSVEDVVSAYNTLSQSNPVVVVKAQIHAGGRGAGHFKDDPTGKGGVRVVKTLDEAKEAAINMFEKTLITKQTGKVGKQVHKVYVEQGMQIEKEFYLSLLLDRSSSWITVVSSEAGGMDIEDVAEKTPEKILRLYIDPVYGIMPFHGRRLAKLLGVNKNKVLAKELFQILTNLYKAYWELDASLIEINPLVVTADDHFMLLDAKLTLEDNGLARHPRLMQLMDVTEEDSAELEAKELGLNYIKLDGNIGCMVNGAGLAMATMDLIKFKGGQPANFLDVGGNATEEMVTSAFGVILSDKHVKGIFVNIFGGIMRCDIIAAGIVGAAKTIGLNVPIVVRLQGTNMEEGKEILDKSGLPLYFEGDLNQASEKIISLVS